MWWLGRSTSTSGAAVCDAVSVDEGDGGHGLDPPVSELPPGVAPMHAADLYISRCERT